MELDDAIEDRRSIRNFKKKSIDQADLKELIKIIRYVPTAHNLQDYYVYVVKNKKTKERLSKACLNQEFVAQVPVVFVFCADVAKEGTFKAELYATQSATMAAYAVCLKAVDLKLGTCMVGFDTLKITEILEIKNNLLPISIVAIGHLDEDPAVPKRKDNYFEIVE